jgi:D-alanyl-lipoteichoic acid acyltransferase DltB (MBOAT superfamily)
MRAKDLIRQFHEPGGLMPRELGRATWLIVSGLFVKVVIADQIGPKLDPWYLGPPTALSAADTALLGLGFGLQMYLDFCGYSRIAIGSGLFAGVRLVENFNFPFAAVSPPDFWNRWHISLSRWIRDYVFLAFVGRSRSLGRLCVAAILSMVLCGLWHGVGIKFVVWGAFHGAVIAGYHLYRHVAGGRIARAFVEGPPLLQRVHDLLGWGATLVVLLPGWILFRAETLGRAVGMLAAFVTPRRLHGRSVDGHVYLTVALLFLAVMLAPFVASAVERAVAHVERDRPLAWRLAIDGARGGVVAVLMATTLLYWGTTKIFIYFQF